VFRRPHHNRILKALNCLDGRLFCEAQCFFGGGTAVTLLLNEYRESVDIDFLCASQDGYRRLRSEIWDRNFEALHKPDSPLYSVRELRADQYGIRTIVEIENVRIKFEIIREARIDLDGAIDQRFGVPVLSRDDMYAEKLLANADRWADVAVLSRDIIDLSMMISRWGVVPEAAWGKARSAYGTTVDDAYAKAVEKICDPVWLGDCAGKLSMTPDAVAEILALHGGPRLDGC
jgi:hypothetical protein